MMNLTKIKTKTISKHHITHVLRDVIGFANSRHIFSKSLVRVKPTVNFFAPIFPRSALDAWNCFASWLLPLFHCHCRRSCLNSILTNSSHIRGCAQARKLRQVCSHDYTTTLPIPFRKITPYHWIFNFFLSVGLVHGIIGVKLELSARNSPEKQRALAKRNRKTVAIKQCAQLGQFCREQ